METPLPHLTTPRPRARREAACPKTLRQRTSRDPARGDNLGAVWDAPTTTDKRIASSCCVPLLDEVDITLRGDDPEPHADLILRWLGGAISELAQRRSTWWPIRERR